MEKIERHYIPKYHWGITQNSTEWYDIRKGRIGGSSISPLLTNSKASGYEMVDDVILSAGAVTLAEQAAAERRGAEPDNYVSKDMEWGMTHEGEAISAYENETGRMVMQCGYISYGPYFGVSLDGAVMAENGHEIERVTEIKCPKAKNFISFEKRGRYDGKYEAQGQWQLYITGAKILDLVFFHPKLGIAIRTYKANEDMHKAFHKKVKPMEKLIARFETPGIVL